MIWSMEGQGHSETEGVERVQKPFRFCAVQTFYWKNTFKKLTLIHFCFKVKWLHSDTDSKRAIKQCRSNCVMCEAMDNCPFKHQWVIIIIFMRKVHVV